MSLLPPTWIVGKRCLIYCGDDRCDCECNPQYHRMIRYPIQSSNAVGSTSQIEDDSTIPVVEDTKR